MSILFGWTNPAKRTKNTLESPPETDKMPVCRFFQKVLNFLKKVLDICPRRSYNRTRSRRERTREYAPVAQLDRVSDYESEGRGFESLPAHQVIDPMQYELFYKTVGCMGSFVVCKTLLL